MNKTVLLQQVYPKMTYLPLLVECFERNVVYCEGHDIDYMAIMSEEKDIAHGGWDKIFHIQEMLKKYELVIWLDVDAIIFDLQRDLREVPLPPDSIGAVKFMLPIQHMNVGVMYFRSGENVNKFIEEWLSHYPGQGAWREQEVFNMMKNKTVVSLPVEWNRNYDMNPSAKPVIMGFHGYGDAERRLELMRKVLIERVFGETK